MFAHDPGKSSLPLIYYLNTIFDWNRAILLWVEDHPFSLCGCPAGKIQRHKSSK